ncbi:MAG: hypothetical protein K6A63_08500 [Acholeplasmatales bacterium]|nr:hypothetical protein [Acholeplasmatales bacterium]
MKGKKKLKITTGISAFITLLSFGYKMGLSVMTMSLVLFIASISTLMVFICKVLFVKNITKDRAKKKKAYLFMALAVLIYALIFIAFVVLKINDIDISNDKSYEGWQGALLIGFMLVMFILTVIGLKGALEKTDIMVTGLQEMTFVSALADLVIIEEFVSRIILEYKEISYMDKINSYFCLGCGCAMILTAFIMLIKFVRYDANLYK